MANNYTYRDILKRLDGFNNMLREGDVYLSRTEVSVWMQDISLCEVVLRNRLKRCYRVETWRGRTITITDNKSGDKQVFKFDPYFVKCLKKALALYRG